MLSIIIYTTLFEKLPRNFSVEKHKSPSCLSNQGKLTFANIYFYIFVDAF